MDGIKEQCILYTSIGQLYMIMDLVGLSSVFVNDDDGGEVLRPLASTQFGNRWGKSRFR